MLISSAFHFPSLAPEKYILSKKMMFSHMRTSRCFEKALNILFIKRKQKVLKINTLFSKHEINSVNFPKSRASTLNSYTKIAIANVM